MFLPLQTFCSCVQTLTKAEPAVRTSDLVINSNFWLKTSEDERSKCVCGSAAVTTSWVGMEEGAAECACQVDPEGGEASVPGRWRGGGLNPPLDVELCDGPLSAGVRVLAVDALAVAFHLGQVLVEDFA